MICCILGGGVLHETSQPGQPGMGEMFPPGCNLPFVRPLFFLFLPTSKRTKACANWGKVGMDVSKVGVSNQQEAAGLATAVIGFEA